jgi:hypothetical protein
MSADERAGYSRGILAASEALLIDLAATDRLPPDSRHGEDAVCVICALSALGFHTLAQRVAFARHYAAPDAGP